MKRIATLLLAVLMIAVMIIPASAKAGDAIITLDINTGAMYSGEPPKHTVLTRIGENDTIAEVTGYLLSVDGGKDYNYFYVYTVEASGDDYVITAIDTRLGRPDGVKGDTVIPENGFLLCFQAGDAANKAIMDTVKVGNYVELNGVDLNELATLDAGANPLAGAATATIKAAIPDSYYWAKSDEAIADGRPVVNVVVAGEDLAFYEAGKTYTAFTTCYFSDDCSNNATLGYGLAYVNWYSYDASGTYLAHADFASAPNGVETGKWIDVESNPFDPTAACGKITLGVGFWNGAGEVRCATVGLKDSEGNVVFEYKFDKNVLEDDKVECVAINADNKGTAWGVEGEKVVTPPTEDAPTTPDVDTPNTGDMTMVFGLVALVAMAGAVVVAKKAR